MTDFDKENQDSLFIRIEDLSKAVWLINKRNIVSAVAMGKVTRIVLSSDATIDSYYPFGQLQRYLHHVGHNYENPTDSTQTQG